MKTTCIFFPAPSSVDVKPGAWASHLRFRFSPKGLAQPQLQENKTEPKDMPADPKSDAHTIWGLVPAPLISCIES
jgi:hypothetical protein